MKSIPANKIKWVRTVGIWVNKALFFNQNIKVTNLIKGLQIVRPFDVAFAER